MPEENCLEMMAVLPIRGRYKTQYMKNDIQFFLYLKKTCYIYIIVSYLMVKISVFTRVKIYQNETSYHYIKREGDVGAN